MQTTAARCAYRCASISLAELRPIPRISARGYGSGGPSNFRSWEARRTTAEPSRRGLGSAWDSILPGGPSKDRRTEKVSPDAGAGARGP
ncbi:hypothetical protein ACHAWF_014083 [Thalassiosira exigua]